MTGKIPSPQFVLRRSEVEEIMNDTLESCKVMLVVTAVKEMTDRGKRRQEWFYVDDVRNALEQEGIHLSARTVSLALHQAATDGRIQVRVGTLGYQFAK